jgi:HAD superfamily hydrolase (TIGR01549 family)
VPRHTFSAVFGAVVARGLDYRDVFQVFHPGFDLRLERQRRAAAGHTESFGEENLYGDARPCLAALRGAGLLVGLAGNQTARAEAILRALDLPVDVIGTSDGWSGEKPSPEFFDRVVVEAGCPAGQVLYVGDRLDNDIRPAQAAGLATALLRRGPWGHILDDHVIADRACSVSAPWLSFPGWCASTTREADSPWSASGCGWERSDLRVDLSTVLAVAEQRPDSLDPGQTGRVPVGGERFDRLAEVAGDAVAVPAMRRRKIGEDNAALLASLRTELAGCRRESARGLRVVARDEGSSSPGAILAYRG